MRGLFREREDPFGRLLIKDVRETDIDLLFSAN